MDEKLRKETTVYYQSSSSVLSLCTCHLQFYSQLKNYFNCYSFSRTKLILHNKHSCTLFRNVCENNRFAKRADIICDRCEIPPERTQRTSHCVNIHISSHSLILIREPNKFKWAFSEHLRHRMLPSGQTLIKECDWYLKWCDESKT